MSKKLKLDQKCLEQVAEQADSLLEHLARKSEATQSEKLPTRLTVLAATLAVTVPVVMDSIEPLSSCWMGGCISP